MSPHTSAPSAAPQQLSYLKDLASQTGTTFTFPRHDYQASREIERLKGLKARRGRRHPRNSPARAGPGEQPYATEQKPGEIIGYGSSARRGDPAPRCAAPRRGGQTSRSSWGAT